MRNQVFDHILVIMFENEYRSYVMQNKYMRDLAAQGTDMANYFGVMHPSQTNYIASIAGELCDVTDDDQPKPLPQKTIVDLVEESPYNLQWKAYMDSYIKQNTPWKSTGFTPKDEFPYMIKHNPFSSFKNILENQDRWERIDDEAGLWKDLANGTFPEYAWFTPNMWNDGHYLNGTEESPHERAPALVDQLSLWLESFFKSLRFPGPDSHLPEKTLVVITFDEADFEKDYDITKKYTYDGPNQIYTVLLGDMINPGVEKEGYNHYSLIKTIEKNFNLDSLRKNDMEANWFQFLWKKRFQWEVPFETPVYTYGQIAIAEYRGILYLVYEENQGSLYFRAFNGVSWSTEQAIGPVSGGGVALSSCNDQLVLVYRSVDESISSLCYTLEQGWSSTPQQIIENSTEKLTLTSYNQNQNLMLAYSDSEQQLHSLIYQEGKWEEEPTAIGHKSDGNITLANLGASLFLIYKTVDCSKMSVVSYNTASFNVVHPKKSKYNGPYNTTTQDQWSPSSSPVAHFSHAASSVTPSEEEPIKEIYQASGPLVCATLDGVIHLAHSGVNNSLVLTEDFSISGVMTPKLPVSYNNSKKQAITTNNGYGTLAQAGWSEQNAIHGVNNFSEGAMAMAQFGDHVILAFQPNKKGGQVHFCRGKY